MTACDVHLAGRSSPSTLWLRPEMIWMWMAGVLLVELVQIGQQELAGDGVAGADGELPHLQLPGLGQLLSPVSSRPMALHSTSLRKINTDTSLYHLL